MTAPFHVHSTYQPYSPKQFRDACDDVAELLSRELTLREIAERMAVTVGTVTVLFVAICERLGERA